MNELQDRRRVTFLIFGLLGFAVVAFLMVTHRLLAFDTSIQDAVFSLRRPWLTGFFVPFSYSGNWQAVTPLCLILLLIPKTRFSYGVPLSATAITAVGFYQALKYAFARPRPDVALHLLTQDGYSFPSGHSLTSLMVWGMLLMLLVYYRRTKGSSLPIYKKKPRATTLYITCPIRQRLVQILIVLYIALMGFSRIYVGVHWPSDVLGSWFLGGAILAALNALFFAEGRKEESSHE